MNDLRFVVNICLSYFPLALWLRFLLSIQHLSTLVASIHQFQFPSIIRNVSVYEKIKDVLRIVQSRKNGLLNR